MPRTQELSKRSDQAIERLNGQAFWYALHLRPRFEQIAAHNLQVKGYEQFLPLYRRRNRGSVNVREIELPLFPGYVFCRFSLVDRFTILMIPGVTAIVGDSKGAAPVNEQELDGLRLILESGKQYEPRPFIRVGRRLRVATGPLAGLEGSVAMSNNNCRLVIPVTLLQRSVAVEIDRHWLRPIALG